MTISARTVRALRDARKRLRDAAAADYAVASGISSRALDDANAADALVDASLAGAVMRLAEARNVADLDHVRALIDDDRAIAAAAKVQAKNAADAADMSAQALASRERQLRSVEKLIERMDGERARGEAKADQRMTDDRAGRKP